MPEEWTLSVWMFNKPSGLNSESTLVRAFERIRLFANSADLSVHGGFITSSGGTEVEPDDSYSGNTLANDNWNYISFSLKINKGDPALQEMSFALAKGRSSPVLQVGTRDDIAVNNYGMH